MQFLFPFEEDMCTLTNFFFPFEERLVSKFSYVNIFCSAVGNEIFKHYHIVFLIGKYYFYGKTSFV